MTLRPIVSVNRAMALTRVSRRTLYYWMADGKVDFCRLASGRRCIFVDSLFRTRDNQPLPEGTVTPDGFRHPHHHP